MLHCSYLGCPLSKFWSERDDFNIVDNHTRGYKLSCCCIFGLGFFSFIQIAFGHALACKEISRNRLTKKNFNLWNFQIAISIV